MTPVVQLYWIRAVLGIVAAGVTAALAKFVLGGSAIGDYTPLINSVTIALLIYFITYYIFKPVYKNKIEKQSKILSTGIGMYFFAWISFYVLIFTMLQIYIP